MSNLLNCLWETYQQAVLQYQQRPTPENLRYAETAHTEWEKSFLNAGV